MLGGAGSGDITAVGNVLTGSAFTGSDSSAIKGNLLVFEGSTVTDDARDVTLTAVNPAAVSHTFTLPDVASGDVCISGVACVATSGPFVTSVGGSAPIVSSGGLTPSISCPTCLTSATTLFTLSSDGGADEIVTSGETVELAGGSGLTSATSAADTVTFNVNTGNGIQISADAVALGVLGGDWDQTGAGDIFLNNAGSNLVILENGGGADTGTFDVASISGDQTYTFGTGGIVCTDGFVCTGYQPAGSYANTALSNLAAVAINTSLLPGGNNTIDLGDGTHQFRTGYIGTSLVFGTSGANNTTLNFTAPSAANTVTIPNVSGTVAVSASAPVGLSASGNITCATCWTSSNDGAGSGLDADLLDALDSSQFLRSDTSDNFTSGTLTTDAGTTLDVNGDISIADTNIALDGASTTLTSTGALTLTPGGALTLGATSQTALLRGSVTTITSTGATNDIILNSADTIELQDNTNITGNLDVSGSVRLGAAGAGNVLNTSAGGAPTGNLFWGDRTLCDSSANCTSTYEVPLTFQNGLTRSVNTVKLGGDLTDALTTITADAGERIEISSNLNAARSTNVLTITQPNNASFNSSANLLHLTNSDIGSTAALLNISQQANSGTGIAVAAGSSGIGIDFGSIPTTGTLIKAGALSGSNTGVLFGNVALGTGTGFSGNYILVNPTYIYQNNDVTHSGNYLNIQRDNQMVTAHILDVTGDLANLSSTCSVSGGGTCTDTSNILELNQQYASASGAVLNILNSGTGADIAFNTSPVLTIGDTGNLQITDGTNELLRLTDAGTTGNLDVSGTLTAGTADAFQVDGSGNVTSGTINGQTVTSSANFTGTVAVTTLAAAAGTAVCRNVSNLLSTCSANANGVTLQQAYDADANGSDTIIALTSNDDSLIFRNPSSSGSDSGSPLLTLDQLNTTATFTTLTINQASNAANAVNITADSIDTETGLSLSTNGLTTGSGIELASSSVSGNGGRVLSIGNASTPITFNPSAGGTQYGTYINITNSPSISGDIAYGVYATVTGSGSLANVVYAGRFLANTSNSSDVTYGVEGQGDTVGVAGYGPIGVRGQSSGGATGYGVYGDIPGSGRITSSYAGYFDNPSTSTTASINKVGVYSTVSGNWSGSSSASYGLYLDNATTNTTTDSLNKYGSYITSTGSFGGGGGAATNNYGLYIDTVSGADNNYAAIFASGNVGIGTTTPGARLEVRDDAAEQLRLSYDATKFTTFTVDTSHDLTIDPSGGGGIIAASTIYPQADVSYDLGGSGLAWNSVFVNFVQSGFGETLTLDSSTSTIDVVDTLRLVAVDPDITTPSGEDLTLVAAGVGVINLNDTVQVGTLAAAGGTPVCRNVTTLSDCPPNANGVTLQQAYDAGNTISTTTGRNIAFTLPAGLGARTSFTLTNNDTTAGNDFYLNNANTSGTTTNGLLIEQTGAGALTNGINITRTAGTLTNGLTFSGTFTKLINSSNFNVTNAGAVTAVGVDSGAGLLQGAGGLTITGTTSINTSGASTTALGNSGTDWNISTSGVLTLGRASNTTGQAVFAQSGGAGTTTFQAGAQGGTSLTYTLPISTPAANSILSSSGGASSSLSWVPNTAASTCTDCLIEVPLSTARNTIKPSAGGIAALTVDTTSEPTVDLVNLTLSNSIAATTGVDTLAATIKTATGAGTNNSALHAVIGTTAADSGDSINGLEVTGIAQTVAGGTQNLIRLTPAASGNTAGNLYGINIDNITTPNSATETALNIGTGWDTEINFTDTTPTIAIGNTGTLSFTDNTNTLCSIADAGTTGNLSCTGNITGSSSGTVGYWQRSGTTISQATAGDVVAVNNFSSAPTLDLFTVSPNGNASTTNGVDGIQLTFGSSNASGDGLHITPSYDGGAADPLTYNAIEVDAFSPTNGAGTDTVNGLKFGNLTDPGATITSNAINIGTGWDFGISAPAGNTAAIDLTGTAGTAVTGIRFGADTNLYRSAASTLKTDNSLQVGSVLGVGSTSSIDPGVLIWAAGNLTNTFLSQSYGMFVGPNLTTSHTDHFGISIANPTVSGLGAVANNYGLFIGNQTRGGTTNYGIYIVGANTAGICFDCDGSYTPTTVTGGIQWGTDNPVKLYRASNNGTNLDTSTTTGTGLAITTGSLTTGIGESITSTFASGNGQTPIGLTEVLTDNSTAATTGGFTGLRQTITKGAAGTGTGAKRGISLEWDSTAYTTNSSTDLIFGSINQAASTSGYNLMKLRSGSTLGDVHIVNGFGDVLSGFTQLDGTDVTNGTGSSSTALALVDSTGFNVGNYVRVDPTGATACSGAVTVCYAKITAIAGNTLTISPALSWNITTVVDEFHIPEVGGTDATSPTLTSRYGQGYFINGVTSGNASTTYSDQNITFLDGGTFTITDDQDPANVLLSLVDAGTTGDLTVTGNITANGTITGHGPTSGDSGFWNRTGSTLNTYYIGDAIGITGNISTSGNISTTVSGTITSAGAITAPTSTNTINSLVINAGALSNVSSITGSGNLTVAAGGASPKNLILDANGTGTVTLANGSTGDIQFFSSSNKITSAGALTVAGAISAATSSNTINNLVINGSGTLSGTLTTLTPSGSFTVGATGQTLTLQGSTTTLSAASGTLTINGASSQAVLLQQNGSNFVNLSTVGALTLSSLGTNQNITIAPSGTGQTNVTGGLAVSGHGAFGSNASIDSTLTLYVDETYTNTSGARIGNKTIVTANPGVDGSGLFFGNVSRAHTASGLTFDITQLTGVEGLANHQGAASSNVVHAMGVLGAINNTGAGTITNAYDYYATNPANSGGGTITNTYGLFLENLTNGTNRYGIFLDDTGVGPALTGAFGIYSETTDQNVLVGNTRIGGDTAPTVALDVTGQALVTAANTSGDSAAFTDTSLAAASANLANFTFKNNSGAGVTVNGITVTEQAAANSSDTSNLVNLTAAAGGTVNGINFGSNFTNLVNAANWTVTNGGAETAVTGAFTGASSLTLGTSSSLAGAVIFKNATNTNTVTIQSGTTSPSYTLTLPTAQSSGTKFLQNDGAGVLSWAAGGACGNCVLNDSGITDGTNTLVPTGDVTTLTLRQTTNGTPTKNIFAITNSGNSVNYAVLASDATWTLNSAASKAFSLQQGGSNFVNLSTAGALTLSSLGTNQNIAITTSGTGQTNVTGGLDVSGHGAFGADAGVSTSKVLAISETFTNTSGAISGINSTVTADPTADGSGGYFGAVGQAQTALGTTFDISQLTGLSGISIHQGTASSSMTYAFGVIGGAINSGAGSIGDVRAFNTSIQNTSTGTITNAYNFYVTDPTNSGGGTITRTFGLYVPEFTVGTNRYGVFIDDSSSFPTLTGNFGIYSETAYQNVLVGNTRIGGDTTPTVPLDVTGQALVTASNTTGNSAGLVANSLTTGTALAISSTATSFNGSLLTLSKTAATSSTAFTGDIANIAYSQTFNGGVGLNSTGNVLDVSRNITLDNVGNTHTISGALVTLSDSGTQTNGTLTNTANVLSLSQNYTNSSGAVLNVSGAGTGNLASLDTTNASANGVSIDVQSASSSQYALNVTSNNGALNGLYVQADGNVGLGLTNPGAKLTVRTGSTDPGTTDDGKQLFVSGIVHEGHYYDGGIEFYHDGLTEGIGFGFNSMYSTGTNTNTGLNIYTKGTGQLTLNEFGGGDIFFFSSSNKITSAGNLTIDGTYNTNTFTSSSLQFGAAGTATVQSAAGQALTLTGNAASTWSTSAGTLSINAGATSLNLQADGSVDVNLAGGTSATGCTITNSSGNLACVGDLTVTGNDITFGNGEILDNNTNNSFTFSTNADGTADKIAITPSPAAGTSFTATISTANLTVGNQTFNFPDLAAASSATICVSGQACSGGTSTTTIGYWTRTGTSLSPNNANDVLSISSNTTTSAVLALTSTGALTSGTSAFSLTGNSIITGTLASISDTAVMTTTGNLLTLNGAAATTTTGLLTINAAGLTQGFAEQINANGAAVLTSGGALSVIGPTGAAAISANSGLVQINAAGAITTTAGAGSGGLLDVQGNAILTGTLASISDTAVMTTTGNLLTLTANAATTATGLLTINATGLTGAGTALNISTTNTGSAIKIAYAAAVATITDVSLDFGGFTAVNNGVEGVIKLARVASSAAVCATATNQGLVFINDLGARIGHFCNDSSATLEYFGAATVVGTDVAENYSDPANNLEPGDIVSMDLSGATHKGVIKSTTPYDSLLLGIVSTASDLKLSGINESTGVTDLTNPKYIALSGRVPTKVSTENGPIKIGDYITASSVPGVGMKATQAGTVLGNALEDYSGTGVAQIEVFTNLGYYPGPPPDTTAQSNQLAALATQAATAAQNVKLDAGGNLVATMSAGTKFLWNNSAGVAVAWVADTGEAVFNKVTSLIGDFTKLIFGELVAKKDAKIAGEASFDTGATEVFVPSDKIKDDSLINLTPTTKTAGVHLYIKEKRAGEGFVVALERNAGDQPTDATASATEQIKFTWFVLNQQ